MLLKKEKKETTERYMVVRFIHPYGSKTQNSTNVSSVCKYRNIKPNHNEIFFCLLSFWLYNPYFDNTSFDLLHT